MTIVQRNLLIGLALAALIAAGLYWVSRGSAPASTELTMVNGVTGTGEFTVEPIRILPPELGPISITADLSAEAKAILRRNIEAQYKILRQEPERVDIWLQLGVNRKIGGDYPGAILAWEYVAAAAPTAMVATARGNLGDLYMYFLKKYDLARANLSAAIAANPYVIEYYRALFYLEKDIFKNPTAARVVVEAGLKANPNHTDLLYLKSQL
jgi:tetratricopeptide (TPR) repeat protein